MNKLSKLTALLLAIVLALGVPMQVMAEGEEIETKTKYYEVADQILQAMIMNYQTYGEYKSMAELIAEEDFVAFYEGLSEEDQVAMANYVIKKFWASCISYTNVGPFLPPIDVNKGTEVAKLSLTERAVTEDESEEADGLFLKKNATDNKDGTYTITLEAYVTGSVTIEQVDVFNPADIVLVLDTSGSMTSDFASTERRYALTNAVDAFIDSVALKYDSANGVDHRIAIVDYDAVPQRNSDPGHGSKVNIGLTEVNPNDREKIAALKAAIPDDGNAYDAGDYEGGTNPALGLTDAQTELAKAYPGTSKKPRSKVVVLFTDGKPSYTSFEAGWTVNAITKANELKAAGYTVFTVAIIPDADPENTIDRTINAYNSDSEIADAFLHAVSSNYKNATATNNRGTVTITLGTGANNGYYLTAETPEDLDKIFQGIASNIETGSTTSTLTETTVVKDVLSPYFELPTGFSASSVTVQTADYKGTKDAYGNLEWDTPVPFDTGADGISFGTDPDTKLDYVNVKNFGFNDNYVADVDHVDPFITNDKVGDSNVFYGRKFIISFKVEPTDGFLGGNNVVTNDGSSGIYQPSTDGTTLEPVKPFPKPNVDVQIVELEIVSNDQHIYLGNAADLDALLKSFSTQYWILENNGKDGIYTVNKVNNEYATIKFTLTTQGSDGKDVQVVYTIPYDSDVGTWTYFIGSSQVAADAIDLNPILTADKVYEVNYEVIPRPRTDPKDTRPSVAGKTGTLYPIVHVHTPTLTFQDSVEDYATPVEKVDGYYATKNFLANDTTWAPHTCTNKYTDKNGVENTATATYNPDGTYTKTCVAGSETTVTTVTHNATDATLFDKLVTVNGVTDPDESKSAGAYGYTFIGTEPTPQITYTPTAAWQTANGTGAWQDSVGEVTATTDVPIVVKVMLNTVDATNMAKLIRNTVAECKSVDTCTWTSGTESQNAPAFVIHITNVMGSLTISKTVDGTGASVDDTFLFTITGPGITGKMQVILKGGQSVTINNLLVGDYVVKEETGWSWRYTCTESDATLEAKVEGNETAAVIFTNTLTTRTWLDGNAHADNDFTGSTTTTEGDGY